MSLQIITLLNNFFSWLILAILYTTVTSNNICVANSDLRLQMWPSFVLEMTRSCIPCVPVFYQFSLVVMAEGKISYRYLEISLYLSSGLCPETLSLSLSCFCFICGTKTEIQISLLTWLSHTVPYTSSVTNCSTPSGWIDIDQCLIVVQCARKHIARVKQCSGSSIILF